MASGTAFDAAGNAAEFSDGRSVFSAAAEGNSIAAGILGAALCSTATAIRTLAHTFLPQRFVPFWGLIDKLFELFAKPARDALSNAVLLPKRRVEIVTACLRKDAGVAGAASLVLKAANNH